jgi:hypothetical protein
MTPAVIASVNRMTQQILQSNSVGTVPFELVPVRTGVRPDRHANSMLDQITQHTVNRPQPIEEIEDQPDDVLDLLVCIQCEDPSGQLHVAAGRVIVDLAASRFVQQPLVHTATQDVQLRFAHGSFEPEQ